MANRIVYDHPEKVQTVTHGMLRGRWLFWKEVDLEVGIVSNNHIEVPEGWTAKVEKRRVVLKKLPETRRLGPEPKVKKGGE